MAKLNKKGQGQRNLRIKLAIIISILISLSCTDRQKEYEHPNIETENCMICLNQHSLKHSFCFY